MQFQALRDLDLRSYQVDSSHHFGDGVFHLDARVDLDEVPLARIGIHQKLDRARVVIAGRARQAHGGIGQSGAQGRIERHRRRHFHHFLMAALHRAVAFMEVQNVAVAVAQNLYFDVAGAAHEAFQEDRIVAESRSSFAAGLLEAPGEIGLPVHHPHAAPAAAESRLDDEREPDLAGDFLRLLGIAHRLLGAGHHRNAGFFRQAPRRSLVAEQFQQFRAGAYKSDAGTIAGARQRRVLGKKAIAGMDGIDALFLRQFHDAFDIQVGLHRALALADEIRFVGLESMQGQAVFLRVDSHRAQPQLVGCAQNANRDFAAIESKKLVHMVGPRRQSRSAGQFTRIAKAKLPTKMLASWLWQAEAPAPLSACYANACSMSAMMSSTASIPTESRTRLSRMPTRSRCFGARSRCELMAG